jgi:phosphate transport system permease protein
MSSNSPSTPAFEPRSLQAKRDFRFFFNILMTGIAGGFVLVALIPLFVVIFHVLVQGGSYLNPSLFTQLPPAQLGLDVASKTLVGGFGNAVLGTLMMVGLASLISVPVGILAAIYLAEFSPPELARWLRFATNLLSGVPSIIIGIFAYAVLVLPLGGFNALAGGFALALIMLPIIIRTTDEALQIVPKDVRWASVGVGASRYQTALRVVLPAALPAIATGVTLSVARASGETAPLIFTALSSQFWPEGILKPSASLAVLVYEFATKGDDNQKLIAWSASLVLVLLVFGTSTFAKFATRRKVY